MIAVARARELSYQVRRKLGLIVDPGQPSRALFGGSDAG